MAPPEPGGDVPLRSKDAVVQQFLERCRSANSCEVAGAGSADLKELPPLCIRDLNGSCTDGRYLFARVAYADAYHLEGSTFALLEDMFGDLVELAVQGLMSLPRGRCIAVVDPHLEHGAVVAAASEVVDYPQTANLTPAGSAEASLTRKALGNAYFGRIGEGRAPEALRCYSSALFSFPEWDPEAACAEPPELQPGVVSQPLMATLSLLMTNCSICSFELQDFAASAEAASVALALDPSSAKAAFRQKKALEKLGTGTGTAEGGEAWAAAVSGPEVQPWAPAGDRSGEWPVLRQRGKDEFQAKDFQAAWTSFAAATATLGGKALPQLAVLFSNRAAVHLHCEQWPLAQADARVALRLDPESTKAWLRFARAAARMGDITTARGVLRQASARLGVAPFKAELAALRPPREHLSDTSTEQQREHRESIRPRDDREKANLEEMRSSTALFARLPAADARKAFGAFALRKPPPIHEEFEKAGGLPLGIDMADAGRALECSYHSAYKQPWLRAAQIRSQTQESFSDGDLVHRFGGPGPAQWCMKHATNWKPGSIMDYRSTIPAAWLGYARDVRSCFANNPSHPEILTRGKTHVAVGFNDLGSLLNAELIGEGELHFIGVEMSPFNVAKTTAVSRMLADDSVPIEHVLQVWYSSTWSRRCEASFRAACADAPLLWPDDRVQAYLRHWRTCTDVPLQDARRAWLDVQRNSNRCVGTFISSLKRVQDRQASCKYVVTGDVGGPADVGSLTMWNVPRGAPPLDTDAIFAAVSIIDILKELEAGDGNVVALVERRLRKYLARLRSARCHIEVHCAVVSLDRSEVVAQIAAWKPWTMSWSNVLDYSTYDRFHALARACSPHGGTVHYGYSMNWIYEVFGTGLVDYELYNKPQLLKILDRMETELPGLFGQSLGRLIVLPPFDTPLNICTYKLRLYLGEFWVEHFLEKGKGAAGTTPGNMGLQLGFVKPDPYEPLSNSAGGTLSLSWTYDPNVVLQDTAGALMHGRMHLPPGMSAMGLPTH